MAARKYKAWLAELTEARTRLSTVERGSRNAKVEKADLAPDVAAECERWLDVYGANKQLVRGVLQHAGKADLMPLIFDDLAETHRTTGTSDEPAPAASDKAAAADAAGAATRTPAASNDSAAESAKKESTG